MPSSEPFLPRASRQPSRFLPLNRRVNPGSSLKSSAPRWRATGTSKTREDRITAPEKRRMAAPQEGGKVGRYGGCSRKRPGECQCRGALAQPERSLARQQFDLERARLIQTAHLV